MSDARMAVRLPNNSFSISCVVMPPSRFHGRGYLEKLNYFIFSGDECLCVSVYVFVCCVCIYACVFECMYLRVWGLRALCVTNMIKKLIFTFLSQPKYSCQHPNKHNSLNIEVYR